MDAARVLPRSSGVVVHDGWAPHSRYLDITHALCGAHVLRARGDRRGARAGLGGRDG
jgi:hypothetical protein